MSPQCFPSVSPLKRCFFVCGKLKSRRIASKAFKFFIRGRGRQKSSDFKGAGAGGRDDGLKNPAVGVILWWRRCRLSRAGSLRSKVALLCRFGGCGPVSFRGCGPVLRGCGPGVLP